MKNKRKRVEEDNRFKTFWRRFWASWVDTALFTPVFLLNLWVSNNKAHFPTVAYAIWHVFGSLIWYGYAIWMHARYGQTIGKMLLKVKVVSSKDLESITLRQVFMRYAIPLLIFAAPMLVREAVGILKGRSDLVQKDGIPDVLSMIFIIGMGAWSLVDILTLPFNRRRRAVHDFIAGTVVVRT